jgi:hypothetical protein
MPIVLMVQPTTFVIIIESSENNFIPKFLVIVSQSFGSYE